MKKILLALSLLVSAALPAADETKPVTYEGQITGVVCASCKAHITAALTQKLTDVVSVDVKAGDTPDTQKLIVVANNSDITKETATEALGTYAKNYQILSLAKK
ncbi:hypothetical protein EI77_04719 [Prosthecobacter fusiformis]|uniref:HMA domain-containing protein n=1 Tax=Prosthecobacter fusiformis TaxID=48464 RepID=A0A4R7RHT6_9BACT|nr:hypothetical protein [Prosthecobacter fusiformis]TDU62451.1 hypothetical protein EI77_04719 [Prosthecobacter fusiformis]